MDSNVRRQRRQNGASVISNLLLGCDKKLILKHALSMHLLIATGQTCGVELKSCGKNS